MRSVVRQVGCAIAFLTRLPVPASVHADLVNLRRSPRWFPLVGVLLGALYALTAFALRRLLPASVIAVVLLTEDALFTGALHLDGLADMADGFGGGHTREDVLRIMRDHLIGSYGAVALILTFLLRGVCLTEILTRVAGFGWLVVIPALSRWGIVLLSRAEPYARDDSRGSGALSAHINNGHLLVATVTALAVCVVSDWRLSVACWLSVAAVTLVMARLCRRRIGGITGDTLGANVVISECVQLLVAVAVMRL